MTALVLTNTDQRGVCTITLNRPDKHNAFNAEVISQLIEAIEAANRDDAIRVIIITGAGKSFSAGADLDWMQASANFDQQTNRNDARQLSTLMRALANSPKPTIARVNGTAFGGGLGLIACCDIAIASDQASFCFSEVKLGLVPAVISPYVLMAIGPRHAKRLFMTADKFSANQALQLQLLHQVVNTEQLDSTIEAEIDLLLKAGPKALTACKQLVPLLNNEQIDEELINLIAALRTSDEGQEGLTAFLQKRQPNWIKH